MTAEHARPHLGRVLSGPQEEVDEGVAVIGVEPVADFLAGHGNLLDVLGELDLGLLVDLDQLVHAPKCGLALACH